MEVHSHSKRQCLSASLSQHSKMLETVGMFEEEDKNGAIKDQVFKFRTEVPFQKHFGDVATPPESRSAQKTLGWPVAVERDLIRETAFCRTQTPALGNALKKTHENFLKKFNLN